MDCRYPCMRNRVRIILGVMAFPLILLGTAAILLLPLWGNLWHLTWMVPLWFAAIWLVVDVAFRHVWESYCPAHERWASDFLGQL